MRYESIIRGTISWMEKHLHEPITAEAVADFAGFSKYHFHRIFQNAVGMSFSEYIRIRRLTNAAIALLYQDKRIIDIAFYYQFESQEAFTRAFKKIYKLPPGRYRTLMRKIISEQEEYRMEEKITGWFLSGGNPYNYEMGIDQKTVHQGKASGYLKSKTVQDSGEFATMMQEFKADQYKGKRMKLSGFIKTENVQSFCGLWMRIDSTSEDVLQFDNMSNRPITGANNWNQYSIVLDVPENSATISFGLMLMGKGHVWVDGLQFKEVDQTVPTTNIEFKQVLHDEPVNLSFED